MRTTGPRQPGCNGGDSTYPTIQPLIGPPLLFHRRLESNVLISIMEQADQPEVGNGAHRGLLSRE